MTLVDLPFLHPILNAAGTLGFHPARRGQDWSGLGGFFTNPVSLTARTPAAGDRFYSFPGGVLMHTGLPNPGFHRVVRKYSRHWERADLPVVVHLLAEDPDDLYRMVRVLEEIENVGAVELGLPPGVRPDFAGALLQAAVGELPVVARVGLEDVPALFQRIIEEGATALSFGPPRGSLPGGNGFVSGRLFGSAVFPQALELLRRIQPAGIPIIFSGGLTGEDRVETVLQAGAAAVQLDLRLWREGGLSARAESSSARR